MAVIKIEAKKDARSTQTICLVQGDRRTQILRFNVNRYDGGVDLMDLRWVIKTRNAAGVEDIYEPAAVEIGMTSITVDWLVDGSVTNDSGMADYELNGLDVAEDGEPIVWKGATGTISMRANIGPKFGESDGMTNIEKLILYVDGELQNVIDAGSAATDAAARANRAADNVEDLSGAVERANTAAQRATDAAAAVEDLEGAVTRANSAAALATDGAMSADAAASMAYSAATRATEAAKNVENIEEATVAAYDAADDARMAAEIANTAGLPAAMIYGRRVMGETAKVTGNPVSFLPDAGSLLQPVSVLEPKQAGSGDPYPMGGGRNKLVGTAVTQTVNGVTFTVNADMSIAANGTATENASFRARANVKLNAGQYIITKGNEDNNISMWFNANGSDYYADGAFELAADTSNGVVILYVPAGVTVNSIVYPMIRLASDPDATYAPPENIRPFIGYDALGLGLDGVNMLNLSEPLSFYESSANITSVIDSNNVKVSISENKTWQIASFRYLLKAGTYTISAKMSGNYPNLGVYVSTEPASGFSYKTSLTADGARTFTLDTDMYVELRCHVTGSEGPSGETWTSTYSNIQIEHGSSVSDFQPYTGALHTVQIGQTVYGGKFDWLTGKLVAEWAMLTLDGTEPWSLGESIYYRAWLGLTNYVTDKTAVVCSHFKGVKNNEYATNMASISGGTVTLRNDAAFGNPSTLTADDFKAYLVSQYAAGTPVQIAYKLAQPIEIQLTPHILTAVEPEQTNTLYGDGSIEVEYVKPLHVSIEERVAAALAAAAE